MFLSLNLVMKFSLIYSLFDETTPSWMKTVLVGGVGIIYGFIGDRLKENKVAKIFYIVALGCFILIIPLIVSTEYLVLAWGLETVFLYLIYKKYNSEQVRVLAFIDRMELAYAAADVIISRAGASSVSELCVVGKPVIFIPSPNVAEDHQTKNARAIADKQAAILLRENELNEQFANTFGKLIADEAQQEALSTHIKALAQPNATKDIVNLILND